MNIFFDMDYTLLGLDNTLRPGSKEVMQQLIDDGHTLYVWSGTGIRWKEVHELQLDPFITDCFVKPLERFVEVVKGDGIPVKPDMVIDDYPEVPTALGGIWVRPYLFKNNRDDEMERVYQIITEYAKTGHSEDSRFRAGEQDSPHSQTGSSRG